MSGLYTRKGLEWVERSDGAWIAEGLHGWYIVRVTGKDGSLSWCYDIVAPVHNKHVNCSSVEDGKEQAQEHHNAVLDKWLEPQPVEEAS